MTISEKHKKIVGALLFTILIVLYLGYPNIKEWNFQRRVERLLDQEKYQQAYSLILKNDTEYLSYGYLNLLKSEIHLGHSHEALLKIEQLVEDEQFSILQELLDEMGEGMGFLMLLFDGIDELTIDENLKPYLAQLHYEYGDPARAIELGFEIKEINLNYIGYLAQHREIEELLEIEEQVPEHLRRQYYQSIGQSIGNRRFGLTLEEINEYYDYLMDFELKDEALLYLGLEFSRLVTLNNMAMPEHPFITENIYFQFYNAAALLNNEEDKEKGLLALSSERFKNFPGIKRVIQLAQQGSMINMNTYFEVRMGRILSYFDFEMGRYFYYHLEEQREIKLDNATYFGMESPEKSYVNAYESENGAELILNKDLEVVHRLTREYAFDFWINDTQFAYVESASQTKKVYDLTTMESKEYTNQVRYETKFEPFVGPLVHAVNDERYISIEAASGNAQDSVISGKKKYYVSRDSKTHEIIGKIEFDFKFLNSWENYIYGVNEEEGFINVLVKMNKQTGEITELPFYSFRPNAGNMRILPVRTVEQGR